MVKVYEWEDIHGSKHLLRTNNQDESILYEGLFVDEVLKRSLILKTKSGTEVEIEAVDWKVYEE